MNSIALPKAPFALLPKDAPAVTRPELERARWRCEACGDDSDLRVAEGHGDKPWLCEPERVVLCRGCRIDDGFLRVCAQRRAAKRAAKASHGAEASAAVRLRGSSGRAPGGPLRGPEAP
jgi:hypothetical protein